MKRKVDAYVVCPYYHSEERQVIYCEGVEKNSAIHMAFATPQQKKDYLLRNCRQFWGRCPVADALNKKWGVSDE